VPFEDEAKQGVFNFRGKSDLVLVSGFIAAAPALHSGQAAEEFRMCDC
tara:strand:- start:8052 stop:8195 length:144 start_codon:yes stop_codon:yes gene_type:complete